MNSCKNCENVVYDDRWGYYKCKIHQHRIKNVDKYLDCENHEPKQWKKNYKSKEVKE